MILGHTKKNDLMSKQNWFLIDLSVTFIVFYYTYNVSYDKVYSNLNITINSFYALLVQTVIIMYSKC